ncbi:MAG: hypothetical protein ABI557_12830, partial [Aureliella sp.]
LCARSFVRPMPPLRNALTRAWFAAAASIRMQVLVVTLWDHPNNRVSQSIPVVLEMFAKSSLM